MSRSHLPKDFKPSPRDLRFVEEFLVDEHVTNAAKRAGFPEKSAHVAGSRLLKRDKIQALIAKGAARMKRAAEARAARAAIKFDITKEALMARLAEIAHADIDQYVVVEPNGVVRVIATEERHALGGAIRKITSNKGQAGLELHGRTQAIELLAKMQGYVKEITETTSVSVAANVPPETMQRILASPEATAAARTLALKLSQGDKPDE